MYITHWLANPSTMGNCQVSWWVNNGVSHWRGWLLGVRRSNLWLLCHPLRPSILPKLTPLEKSFGFVHTGARLLTQNSQNCQNSYPTIKEPSHWPSLPPITRRVNILTSDIILFVIPSNTTSFPSHIAWPKTWLQTLSPRPFHANNSRSFGSSWGYALLEGEW